MTRFHGPLSPVGAALGIVLVSVPFAVESAEPPGSLVLWVVGPLAGLVLLAVPGRARHLGTGLLASALVLPLLLLAVLAVAEYSP